MRFIALVLALLIVGFASQSFLPWWTIIPIAGITVLLFNLSTSQRFLGAFLAVFLLWGGYAGYLNNLNEGILSTRMGDLLGGQSGMTMVFASALLGGIFAGLGALSFSLGAQLFSKTN